MRIPDEATAMQLFQIAREAVLNALKHARATEAVVRLGRMEKDIVLSVEDDGTGLALQPATSSNEDGLGLDIMRHRSSLIGADLRFDARLGGGTAVSCRVPATE